MIADIVSSTEVVVATCIAAGELADSGLFKVVLIDEASQSTVPTCLVPISKGCRQLVLVGDRCGTISCLRDSIGCAQNSPDRSLLCLTATSYRRL